MHIAHLQQRAGNAHGEVQARAFADELVVHVAAVVPHEAVDHVLAVGSAADDADHRADGDLDLVEQRESVDDGDLLGAVAGRLEQGAAVIVGGDGSLVGHLDVVDVDDEHIAGLGSLDEDRAGGGVGESVGVVQIRHGHRFVGYAVREAVERFEQQQVARRGGGAGFVVLGERVDLGVDDLHKPLLRSGGSTRCASATDVDAPPLCGKPS